jgi:uncharacterized repeat protein (TIGR02543 family)
VSGANYMPTGAYIEKVAELQYDANIDDFICVNTYLVVGNVNSYGSAPDDAIPNAEARIVSCSWVNNQENPADDAAPDGTYRNCTPAWDICYKSDWNNQNADSVSNSDVLTELARVVYENDENEEHRTIKYLLANMTETSDVKNISTVNEWAACRGLSVCPEDFSHYDDSIGICYASIKYEGLDHEGVTFKSGEVNPDRYVLDDLSITLFNPEWNPHHEFTGWCLKDENSEDCLANTVRTENGVKIIERTIQSGTGGDLTFVAQWQMVCPTDYSHYEGELTNITQCHANVDFYANNGEVEDAIHEYLVQYTEGATTYTIPAAEFPTENSETYPLLKKKGHKLAGWYQAATPAEGDVAVNAGVDTFDGDTALYANWAPIHYTVVFNGHGHTDGSMDNQGFDYNEEKKLSKNTYGNNGYNFDGWCDALNTETNACATDATHYSDEQSVSNLAERDGVTVNLYAEWSPIKYNIVFNGNGNEGDTDILGNTSAMNDLLYDVTYPLSTNGYGRTGYDFVNWCDDINPETKLCTEGAKLYEDGESVSKLTTEDGGTVNLYANWNPVEFTVKLKLNEGTCADADCGACAELNSETGDCVDADLRKFATFTVESDSLELPVADKLTKTGNQFVAWCLEAEPTQDCLAAYADKIVTDANTGTQTTVHVRTIAHGTHENLTFEARWVPTICPVGYIHRDASDDLTDLTKCYAIVSYDTDGGTPEQEAIKKHYYNETVGSSYKLSAEELPTVAKTGHDFVAWYDRDIAVTTETVFEPVDFGNGIPTLDRTLKANWTPYTYTIKFDGNGADGGVTMTDMPGLEYGRTYNLNPNTFENSGHSFEGWCTKYENDSCVGDTYSDEDFVQNLTDEKNGVVTLYAMWATNTYTVHFKKNAADSDAYGTKADKDDCVFNEPCDITNNNEFVGIDYEFVGWKEEGTETTYVPNSEGKIFMTRAPSDDQEVTLLAMWAPVCKSGKYLHIGDDVRMCLYATSRTTPSLVIMIDNVKYYANMCKASECDKTITGTTPRKLDIMYNEEVYNVYDLTAQ